MRSLVVAGTLALVLIGCDRQRVFEENRDLTTRHWLVADTATFAFRIQNSGLRYNLYGNLRHGHNYPFARIFVQFTLTDSAGQALASNLKLQQLFDAKTGAPLGRSGLGDLYDHQFELQRDVVFNRPGLYRLKLVHQMRTDTLPEVLAVGVRVERQEAADY
jgi:gliding motility-associated lipoprotein GldH